MAEAIVIICALLFGFCTFLCIIFQEPILDYIEACAEAKRNREERFKLIDEWLKEELLRKKSENENHDAI